ncbi:MAG: hypothetical protein ABFD77_10220 [Thermotogota bacterium]
MSRFLAKTAIEALAQRLLAVSSELAGMARMRELDPLRVYARRGGPETWPYHSRRLYPPHRIFGVPGQPQYQVLHEWTFVLTDANSLFFILALFGDEYAIDMGAPSIDRYLEWLAVNQFRSPLYPQGIKEGEGDDGKA